MRISSTWRRPLSRHCTRGSAPCLLVLTSLASLTQAFTITPVPSPDLDLSKLGNTGIAGDFTGISLYQWEGQNESPFTANGSETLMTQLPNGQFINVLDTDASIQTLCSFKGALILGGNFTSLGGREFTAIASLDLNTTALTNLTGLTGQVNSLLCDDEANMVYVGGSFQAGTSTNAITWVGNNGWTSLPFAGFNGPVTSITKAKNGHVIFGGSFTGLGNTTSPTESSEMLINLSTANISASQGTTTTGFSDPENVVCKTGGVDGADNTWLLEDDTAGSWTATFQFGFEPTKLRLYNTHQDGRGTKTWRFTALPIDGIMNFTYIDPATNQNASCTSECPLSDDSSVQYQDFYFVNRVGMNEFRIDVSEWYGSGGGFDGIALYQEDMYTYAINDFNEPPCSNESFPSTATSTGSWSVTPSGESNSEYLSAQLTGTISSDSAAVTFYPDVRESGNYTVSMYTPGCMQDNTCSSRGQVNVTWTLTSDDQTEDNSKILYQSNNYDKYDVLFSELMDAASSSFRPSIVLTPANNQDISNLTIVAQRISLSLQNSTGGLNGLFEYDPSKATVDTADFTSSAFDKLGSTFAIRSAVASLAVHDDITYIGGNFSSDSVKNIVGINTDSHSTVELDGGLNGAVSSLYVIDDQIYAGGSFDNTLNGSTSGLNHVAIYNPNGGTWSTLGAGVDGPVASIAPISLNISSDTPETVVALTGSFSTLIAFGDNSEISVSGFAIWVPSQSNWLQNIGGNVPTIDGILTTSLLDASDGTSVYAGSLSSQAMSANGAVTLGETLGTFPVKFTSQSSTSTTSASISKRASVINSTETLSGVQAGAFYNDGAVTILAGHFSATASNGSDINNLVIVDSNNGNTTTGLPSGISEGSIFYAVAVQDDNLFAGGRINGTVGGSSVNGLVSYNLANAKFNGQPPALVGYSDIPVVVTSIKVRPNTGDVYVGGSFKSAGSLDCPGVCNYATSDSQWNRPGLGFVGNVSSLLWWTSSTLLAGGQLSMNNSAVYLASYDASSSTWSAFSSASSLPGPVDAITSANSENTQLWAAGTASDSTSVYLMKYDGSTWQSAGVNLNADSVVKSLQVFTVTSSHDSTSLMDANQVLMITGSLSIPGFGTASSVLFNGTTLQPYALTGNTGNTAGSISHVFVQNENFFTSGSSGLAVGFIVLIALAISLGLMLLIVVAGLLLDRYRKKRDGYVPAPTSMYDRGGGMSRIPPEELLDSLGKGRAGAPHI
ncbi:putative Cellular morphogenesis protein [Seiridium cardinale]|uniref:Cellular morphogenesis protein n=1 Tax=Seiridium cardinale TaxID=138064 RepID=A0ABR2XII2_9PEZI